MANEKKPAVTVPHSAGTGPRTAGKRPFDPAGTYGRQETPEDAARLPGLPDDVYKEHVLDYHERLAQYTAKARGESAVSHTTDAAEATSARGRK